MEIGIFRPRKKSKNRVCCTVRGCGSKANKDLNVIFHKFPKPGERFVDVENFFGNLEKIYKLKAWKNVLKLNEVTPRMTFCSLHFKKSDYILPDYNSGRNFLKKTAVPSCNLPERFGTINTVKSEVRLQRRLKRDHLKKLSKKQNILLHQSPMRIDESVKETPVSKIDEVIMDTNEPPESAESTTSFDVTSNPVANERCDIGVQVETMLFTPKFMDYLATENDFSTATGIQSYEIFETLVGIVQIVYKDSLPNCRMTLRERIIMTYVKLKQNVSYTFIALLFKKYTAMNCRRIFYTTLEMLSTCLKVAIPWPSKEEISKNLPACFKDFEDTRVVVDCTEIFIQAPKKLCCQELRYSNYKGSTTCKIMTAVTPGGLISYFSKSYGGRATDTIIFQQSDLTTLLEPGDAVMTDRGFLIEELCLRNNWKLIRPPFMKDKKQLSKNEAILTSKIAKARVHIERCNQRIKTFEILGGTMSAKLVPVLDQIFTVVCGTVNLSSPIFKDDKFMEN